MPSDDAFLEHCNRQAAGTLTNKGCVLHACTGEGNPLWEVETSQGWVTVWTDKGLSELANDITNDRCVYDDYGFEERFPKVAETF